jgi:PhzF family phenazine biosynthesis protein
LLEFKPEKAVSKDDGSEEFVFHQLLGGIVSPVKILRKSSSGENPIQYSVSITQATPKAHGQHPEPAMLAESIGLSPNDIGLATTGSSESKTCLVPRVMSTSTTHHLLVPIASIEALERASVQRDRLIQQLLLADEHAYGLYLFARDHLKGSQGNTYQARFFSPGMSGEDPATGSAAGPMSAFLHSEGHLQTVDSKASIEVWQGLQVGRECVLHVDLIVDDGKQYIVDIVGRGVQVSEGRILIY